MNGNTFHRFFLLVNYCELGEFCTSIQCKALNMARWKTKYPNLFYMQKILHKVGQRVM